MDLSTTYLGLNLPHPLMAGASPMVDTMDSVRRLEDAGSAAIVLYSLFEEQIVREEYATMEALEQSKYHYAEMITVLPEPQYFRVGPDDYLHKLEQIKQAVGVPVFGSLNGVTLGRWLEYGHRMEEAGADALELNVYFMATDLQETAQSVEDRTVEMVQAVTNTVKIPVAVKLSPFYTALPNLVARLKQAGAKGVVLFNRFYQPDIDVEELEVANTLHLSDSSELLLRLRWLAIVSGRLAAANGANGDGTIDLAASGGVHTPLDAIKAIMCGANAVQVVSALLKHGSAYLTTLREGVEAWLKEHEYESLRQAHGSMNLERSPDPLIYERANYMRILQSVRVTGDGWEPRLPRI